MPTSARRLQLLISTLVVVTGLGVGWWQAQRTRSRFLREQLDVTRRCAAAFHPDETLGLTGTPTDFANPVYPSIKARLARLRQVNPRVRSVCLFRYTPGTGKTVLLADSEPPDSQKISNPGDRYAGSGRPPGWQAILQGPLPTFGGPQVEPSGTWITGYAPIGEPPPAGDLAGPREILALEIAADQWQRDQWVTGLRAAVFAWLLLALPLGGFLIFRRLLEQGRLIRKLSQAVEQSRLAVVTTGLDRRIEYVNAGLCVITGWRREDILGQSLGILASSETVDGQFEEIFNAACAGRTWLGETVNRRRDGSTYPARVVASPVFDEAGRLTYVIVVIEDVTERRQVEAALVYAKERAEAGERAKGQFLAMMGHEIRTPLNGIIGFTSLLLDTPLTAEQRECVQTIRNSGESLLQLTSDVLDYSKIDAGRLSLEPQPCTPLECVEAAFELLAARAAEKRLELLHAVAADVPAVVLADAGRLRQVLFNLVGNAIKFTVAGEIEVTVRSEPPPEGRHPPSPPPGSAPDRPRLLTFAVRDTGIGVAPENQGKLFKPFSQIDSSSTRKYGGAGLGLAISQSLVQMMGGEISVVSEVGRGTTFTFTITAGEMPAETGSAPAPDASAFQGRTLAVAGGSVPLRGELIRLVESWGARTLVCQREQLAAEQWDLAIIDLAAAEAEAWRQVLQQRPELPSRPLVALIPVDFPAEERDALRGYFRAMVRKPARHGTLRALLVASLQPVVSPLPAPGPRSAGGLDLRVLLVEDNPVNQRLTQKILENLGCHWDLAEDGRLALTRLDRGTYDLVLLDLHLPEVDGFAVIEQIRRGKAGLRNQGIWIIALAADAQESQRLRIMTGGVNDCLARPFKPADLETALRRSLGYVSSPR
ncbi:MAG: ATP-binding protein [Opitutaceae bacterium]|nr:ATP-binding protein [Opitutaceae bacterium]